MAVEYDSATLSNYNEFANDIINMSKTISDEFKLDLDIGVLCNVDNALLLINELIKCGASLTYIEDTIDYECEHCSLFGGFRVVGIFNNEISLYCSSILNEKHSEFDELFIEDCKRTHLILDFCEIGYDNVIVYNIKDDLENNSVCNKCEFCDDLHEIHKEHDSNNDENISNIIATININGNEKTYKFKTNDEFLDFYN